MSLSKDTNGKSTTGVLVPLSRSIDQNVDQPIHPHTNFQSSQGALCILRSSDIVQLQRTIGNRAVQRMIIQRMEVTDLKEKDLEKWYFLRKNVVAKFTGIYDGNKWEFRIRDDIMGNDQFVYLTSGEVEHIPKFDTVINNKYEGDEENWFGEIANYLKEETKKIRSKEGNNIKEMNYNELLSIGEKMSTNEVGPDNYDTTHVKMNEGVWTDGMGPCITIALTGIYKGNRINVLHHSFVSHYDSKEYVRIGQDIINELTIKVGQAINASLSDLQEQAFYVVGGDSDTASKMEALLRTMVLRQFNIVQVVDKSNEAPGTSSKALLISADGTVSWSYQAKK